MLQRTLVALLLSTLFLLTHLAHAGSSFSQIYIFGDSLSDTGNLGSINGGIPAPYFNNRISNGPVAVETLAAKLGFNANASLHIIGPQIGTNYAVAGANAFGNSIIDLPAQISGFQANNGFIAPADALYVMFIGGNDVRDARNTIDIDDALLQIRNASTQVKDAIETLTLSGARHFLLVNSPSIAVIPETQLIADALNDKKVIKRAKRYSKRYRKQLKKIADLLQDQYDIEITYFDLYRFFNKVLHKAKKYGFTNTTDACFSTVTFTFHPDCNFGLNADQFAFWDEIHPTARLHEIVGEAFFESIQTKTK